MKWIPGLLAVLGVLGLGLLCAAPAGAKGKAGSAVGNQAKDIPIACILDTFSPADRAKHEARIHHLESLVMERRELSDGFEFRFPSGAGTVNEIGNWVEVERLCCPFMKFTVDVEPGKGPVWVKLTGDARVKEFVAEAFRPWAKLGKSGG